jgi:hypothetical protein
MIVGGEASRMGGICTIFLSVIVCRPAGWMVNGF